MPLYFSFLDKAHATSPDRSVGPPMNPNQHIRLTRKHKPVPVRDSSYFYSRIEKSDIRRAQSTYSITSESVYSQHQLSTCSTNSFNSVSSPKSNKSSFKRTRAKTPVFAVGQLEAAQSYQPMGIAVDPTEALAEQYRALLPLRITTPFVKPELLTTPRRTLRKIKAQQSLYRLTLMESRRASISDSETLLGSEPSSPLSPTYLYSDIEKHAIQEQTEKRHVLQNTEDDVASRADTDMVLTICMDLLRYKLATLLSRQHPIEDEDRFSGLEILLLIRAYETVQQYTQQTLYQSLMEECKGRVRDADRSLEYALQLLYSVYDLLQEGKGRKGLGSNGFVLPPSLPPRI